LASLKSFRFRCLRTTAGPPESYVHVSAFSSLKYQLGLSIFLVKRHSMKKSQFKDGLYQENHTALWL